MAMVLTRWRQAWKAEIGRHTRLARLAAVCGCSVIRIVGMSRALESGMLESATPLKVDPELPPEELPGQDDPDPEVPLPQPPNPDDPGPNLPPPAEPLPEEPVPPSDSKPSPDQCKLRDDCAQAVHIESEYAAMGTKKKKK